MTEPLAKLMVMARSAKSAQELKDLAAQNGIELTDARCEELMGRFASEGSLGDDELLDVAGGGCGGGGSNGGRGGGSSDFYD